MGTIYVDEDTINSKPLSSATAEHLHGLGLVVGNVPVPYGPGQCQCVNGSNLWN
jgi:hypothetical protein